MKYYEQLLSKACFTWDDVCNMVGNRNTASGLIQSYLQKGYIQSVKRNLYVAINLADNSPVANRFIIGSCITDSTYISHHSAFAYYGYTNQVMYDVYVSSNSFFTPFEYDGMSYVFLRSRIDEGVENKADGVRVTDLERTVIDSINDFEKVGGLEELLRSLSMLPFVDEEKLLYYLKCYNKQVLYQKVGYILEHFKEEINISENFFNCCETGVFKSVRYLHKNLKEIETEYNKRWRIFVPKNLLSIISEGGNDDAGI